MTGLVLWLIFTTIVGACVGSFLNVVIYRLPAGESLVSPPSHCPKCQHKLAWYDNVPVLGWLWLRGKCRYCANPISAQYPIIEAITGLLVGGWFYICYFTNLRPDFSGPGLDATWLIFLVNGVLLAGLLAATLIDARHFIIPLQIPWAITLVAFVLLPMAVAMWPWSFKHVELPPAVQNGMPLMPSERLKLVDEPYRHSATVRIAIEQGRTTWPTIHGSDNRVDVCAVPHLSYYQTPRALCAMVGLIVAIVLLRLGVLPRSFDDELPEDDQAHHEADDPEVWLAHPHPRREVLKECLFLALPFAGWFLGGFVQIYYDGAPLWFTTLGGVVLGYLAGAVTVWATRILGTLGFGKEAMGLGDVHLMGAVGAVCGWQIGVLAFFVAPFLGLAWTAGAAGLSKLMHREIRVIPYGPHLAAATVILMVMREPVLVYFGMLLGG